MLSNQKPKTPSDLGERPASNAEFEEKRPPELELEAPQTRKDDASRYRLFLILSLALLLALVLAAIFGLS